MKNPNLTTLSKLYVATFNRAPDAPGLDYWIQTGMRIEDIASSFFDSPEAQAIYPSSLSNSEFINIVYQNMFNRAPDTPGFNYWLSELNDNKVSRSNFILAVMNGAQDSSEGLDKTTLINKAKVGIKFSSAGLANVNDATIVMSDVDETTQSVEDAIALYNLNNLNINNLKNNYNNIAVILMIGQSNNANHGAAIESLVHSAKPCVFNYGNGDLHKCLSPIYRESLHLASGQESNMIGLLGDALTVSKYDSVVFVNISMGGSSITQWQKNSGYYSRIDTVDNYEYQTGLFERVQEALGISEHIGLDFTHVLWHQGETDNVNNMSKDTYKELFESFKTDLRNSGIQAPIYMARASYLNKSEEETGGYDSNITDAQKELIQENSDILAGPNTDTLGDEFRYDYAHFNIEGLRKLAKMWEECIN